jgi:rare lipoprotein A (peptidoglycan hydrolase)
MAKEKDQEEKANFDAKEMLKENADKGTVIRFSDRAEVRLLKNTVYQKAGKVYSPHKVKAEALVKQGIAEYVK